VIIGVVTPRRSLVLRPILPARSAHRTKATSEEFGRSVPVRPVCAIPFLGMDIGNDDLHPMIHRLALVFAAFLTAPSFFAQGGTTPPAQVQVEERPVSEETITVEPIMEVPVVDPNEPLRAVELMPEFPGGQEALMRYLGSKIEYPVDAVENGIEGTVFITFVVEPDGRITNVMPLRGLGAGLTEEAIRVAKGMPNWKPGMQRGKAVRVQYNLPIRFKL
jgi:TonB family protein